MKQGADTDGLPAVTLAGESYFVARTPLRHRIAIALLQPKINALVQRFKAAFPDPAAIAPGEGFDLGEDEFFAMVDVVSHGLVPLYPGATREALLDADIAFEELYAAWPVVAAQAASRRHAAGEALATNITPGSSGESSSPSSP
jgi:hypothetical protein